MSQHFLLSPAARTLTIREVLRMSEVSAYARFKALRWASSNGEPICPGCGSARHWTLVEDRKWKCREKECRLQFTVTSKTIFASRKMAFRDIMGAIAIFVNGVLGVAACRMIRDMGCAYKTAFVLEHKLREAMSVDYEDELEGVVEIDGAYFGKRIPRMPNQKDRWDEFRRINRRRQKTLVAIVERSSGDPDRLAKIRTFVVPNEGDGISIARRLVRRGSQMHADESTQWEPLHMFFETRRINHSVHFSDGNACTNAVESFFSRMRCGERGVYRRISSAYLERYGWEMAWREEHCRIPNGRQVDLLIGCALRSGISSMAGYWQRHRPSRGPMPSPT